MSFKSRTCVAPPTHSPHHPKHDPQDDFTNMVLSPPQHSNELTPPQHNNTLSHSFTNWFKHPLTKTYFKLITETSILVFENVEHMSPVFLSHLVNMSTIPKLWEAVFVNGDWQRRTLSSLIETTSWSLCALLTRPIWARGAVLLVLTQILTDIIILFEMIIGCYYKFALLRQCRPVSDDGNQQCVSTRGIHV
jgi:hypothetical protein